MTDLIETRLWGDRFGCQALRSAGDAPALQLSYFLFLFFYGLANPCFKLRRLALIRLSIGFPLGIALLGDLLHGAASFDRLVVELFRNCLCVGARLEDYPLIFFIVAATNPHEGPFAFRLPTVENEVKLALAQRFQRLFTVNVISAAVPNHHGAAAVLSFRN